MRGNELGELLRTRVEVGRERLGGVREIGRDGADALVEFARARVELRGGVLDGGLALLGFGAHELTQVLQAGLELGFERLEAGEEVDAKLVGGLLDVALERREPRVVVARLATEKDVADLLQLPHVGGAGGLDGIRAGRNGSLTTITLTHRTHLDRGEEDFQATEHCPKPPARGPDHTKPSVAPFRDAKHAGNRPTTRRKTPKPVPTRD